MLELSSALVRGRLSTGQRSRWQALCLPSRDSGHRIVDSCDFRDASVRIVRMYVLDKHNESAGPIEEGDLRTISIRQRTILIPPTSEDAYVRVERSTLERRKTINLLQGRSQDFILPPWKRAFQQRARAFSCLTKENKAHFHGPGGCAYACARTSPFRGRYSMHWKEDRGSIFGESHFAHNNPEKMFLGSSLIHELEANTPRMRLSCELFDHVRTTHHMGVPERISYPEGCIRELERMARDLVASESPD